MAEAIIMPRQGQSVESCIITQWDKKEGDHVEAGDILFSYETDKASFDEEAKVSGTLLKILAQEGDDVPVLEYVAVIGDPGEDISEFLKKEEAPASEAAPSASVQDTPQIPESPVPSGSSVDGDRLKISPRAKALAEEQGIDASQAAATGPNGRIIERDVRSLIASGATISSGQKPESVSPAAVPHAASAEQGAFTDTKISNVRKVIAKAMHRSLSEMAQLTMTASFDATDILAYRKRLKADAEELGLANITLNDVVLFAVSRVLPDYPDLNAQYLEEEGVIRVFSHVHLGMAVDTPRGLLVPTVSGADQMSLNGIAARAKDLAKQAQAGSISPDLLSGASFSVTNLGAFGVESFTPVINPPQVAILGVNTIETRVRDIDGTAVPYPSMGLSLTIDHRAVDGAPAARFLQALCKALTNFTVLLAK